MLRTPTDSQLMFYLAFALLRRENDPTQCLSLAEKVVSMSPHVPKYHILYGKVLFS
jgi:hypothetical protein